MSRRRSLASATLAALAVVALSGATAQACPRTTTATITTTAIDRVTGQPVADVCVFAVTGIGGFNWWDGARYGCSDATGAIEIGDLAPGSYRLYADTTNETHGAQWVGTSGGAGTEEGAATVRALAGQVVAGPAVRLDDAGTITGTVTDATGQPLAGVCVFPHASRSYDPQYPVSTCSDTDGVYTVPGLGPYAWPLLYTGSTTALMQWSGGQPTRRTATLVRVIAGGTTIADETIGPRAVVVGKVVFRDGKPASGATVWAYSADTGDFAADAGSVADEDGTFSLRGITGPQAVRVAVRAGGYLEPDAPVLGWYRHATSFHSATDVFVPAGGSTSITVVIGGR